MSIAEKITEEIRRSKSAGFLESANVYFNYLESRLVGFNKLARKLRQVRDQPQQFLDFLKEAHWALLLIHHGSATEYEPLGEPGPDFRVQHSGCIVDCHCKRLRNDPKTAQKLANYGGKLVKYGNRADDSISVFDRITNERPKRMDLSIPQLILYWSDSERVEEHEFNSAIESFRTAEVEEQHSWISGVIYKVKIFQQFEHWYNPYASTPVPNELRIILRQLDPHDGFVANCP